MRHDNDDNYKVSIEIPGINDVPSVLSTPDDEQWESWKIFREIYNVSKEASVIISTACHPVLESDIEDSLEMLRQPRTFTHYVYVEHEEERDSFIHSQNETGIGIPIYVMFINQDFSAFNTGVESELKRMMNQADYYALNGYLSVEWSRHAINIIVDCERFQQLFLYRKGEETVTNSIMIYLYKNWKSYKNEFVDMSSPYNNFLMNEFNIDTDSQLWPNITKILEMTSPDNKKQYKEFASEYITFVLADWPWERSFNLEMKYIMREYSELSEDNSWEDPIFIDKLLSIHRHFNFALSTSEYQGLYQLVNSNPCQSSILGALLKTNERMKRVMEMRRNIIWISAFYLNKSELFSETKSYNTIFRSIIEDSEQRNKLLSKKNIQHILHNASNLVKYDDIEELDFETLTDCIGKMIADRIGHEHGEDLMWIINTEPVLIQLEKYRKSIKKIWTEYIENQEG